MQRSLKQAIRTRNDQKLRFCVITRSWWWFCASPPLTRCSKGEMHAESHRMHAHFCPDHLRTKPRWCRRVSSFQVDPAQAPFLTLQVLSGHVPCVVIIMHSVWQSQGAGASIGGAVLHLQSWPQITTSIQGSLTKMQPYTLVVWPPPYSALFRPTACARLQWYGWDLVGGKRTNGYPRVCVSETYWQVDVQRMCSCVGASPGCRF